MNIFDNDFSNKISTEKSNDYLVLNLSSTALANSFSIKLSKNYKLNKNVQLYSHTPDFKSSILNRVLQSDTIIFLYQFKYQLKYQ